MFLLLEMFILLCIGTVFLTVCDLVINVVRDWRNNK